MTNAERVASLTDDELRRSLDRAGLPLALRLRENELTLERGIGPGGRTYTLYDKTGVLALDDADEIGAGPPFDRPARGITMAEVVEWVEFQEGGSFLPTPETAAVMEVTNAMPDAERRAIHERLVRARGDEVPRPRVPEGLLKAIKRAEDARAKREAGES